MIRDYQAFLARRWNELDMPAKILAVADNEDAQRPLQVSWLVQVVGELRHTTLHEGRAHPDVGLLFKDAGNHFDAGGGLKIANDIICVRETNAEGDVTDANAFAIVDCIISVNRHPAHPGWIVNGMAVGADVARFREAPVPATAERPPDAPGGTPATPAVTVGLAPDARPPAAPDGDTARALAQIATLLQEMRAGQDGDREVQRQMVATLEGIRRDLDNTAKLLVTMMEGGGLGNIADLLKR